jgi:ActR/RegA family two-component response regulator
MLSELGALRVVDPVAWETRIRRELASAGGHIATAAKSLGVSVRQLSRWLAELPNVPRGVPGRRRAFSTTK